MTHTQGKIAINRKLYLRENADIGFSRKKLESSSYKYVLKTKENFV